MMKKTFVGSLLPSIPSEKKSNSERIQSSLHSIKLSLLVQRIPQQTLTSSSLLYPSFFFILLIFLDPCLSKIRAEETIEARGKPLPSSSHSFHAIAHGHRPSDLPKPHYETRPYFFSVWWRYLFPFSAANAISRGAALLDHDS